MQLFKDLSNIQPTWITCKCEFYLSKSGDARFYIKNICVLCMPKKHAMEYHVRQGIAALFLFKFKQFFTYVSTKISISRGLPRF